MKERLMDVVKVAIIIVIAGAVFYGLAQLLGRDPLSLLSMLITALATVAIAVYAHMSHKLSSKIQSRDDEYRKHVIKLYKAIVISNLIDPDSHITSEKGERAIKVFNELYKKGESQGIRIELY